MNKLLLKIGFNTSVQVMGKVVSVILSLITVALLTRYLGSAGYGDFTLVFAYVSFFSVISDFGLQLVMVRTLSEAKNAQKLYGHFFSLKILLILLSLLLAIITLFFFPYSFSVKFGIFIALTAVAVSGITNYGMTIFQSRIRLDLVTLIDVITRIVTVAFILIFVYLKLNLFFIIATVLLGNSAGLIITYVLLKETFRFTFDRAKAKEILLMSAPIGLMSFVGLAYFKIDAILLSVLRNSTEVGLYSVSYKILENFLVVWGFYMASAFPLFSKFKGKQDFKNMNQLFKHSFFIAIAISLAIITVVVLFAPLIIDLLAGSSFQLSTTSLRILIFSLPFLFVNNLISDLCIVLKAVRIAFIGIVASLVINIVLNIWLIPLYGFIGASYVTVLSAMLLSLYNVVAVLVLKLPYKTISSPRKV